MSSPLAVLVAIAVLTAWTIWILRTGRAGRWVQSVPVIAGIGAGGFYYLAIRAMGTAFDGAAQANPANKASSLAQGLGHASFLWVAAWVFISVAGLLLVILSLRQPSDPDAPSARVVREPHPDR